MPPRTPVVFCLILGGLLSACASSQPTRKEQAAESAALGTWEYVVDGRAPLNRGRFVITREKDRLRAVVRDQYRGRLYARVSVHESRLELRIDDLRISGHIDGNRFRGFLRRRQWDVSMRPDIQRSAWALRRATITAERITSGRAADEVGILDCESILRETSGCS